MVRFVVLASILCLPAVSSAQDKQPVGPLGCPPSVVMAKASINGGKVELVLQVPVPVTRQEIKNVVVNGKAMQQLHSTTFSVMVPKKHIVDGKDVTVTRKDGKKVEIAELPKLLAKSTAAVLLCGKTDPYFLQVLRDDVLIVRVPESASPIVNFVPPAAPVLPAVPMPPQKQ